MLIGIGNIGIPYVRLKIFLISDYHFFFDLLKYEIL